MNGERGPLRFSNLNLDNLTTETNAEIPKALKPQNQLTIPFRLFVLWMDSSRICAPLSVISVCSC